MITRLPVNYKELINKITNVDCFDLMKTIPSQSVNLIFCDPPYFEIKGDFDYGWTFDEWKDLHLRLAIEFDRVLAPNGTILLWGHAKKIAYQQVIFDEYFNLVNSGVWEKPDCQTRKLKAEEGRCLLPVTERFLVYDRKVHPSGRQVLRDDLDLYLSIKEKADKELKNANLTVTQARDLFGSSCGHFFGYTLNKTKVQFSFPIKEMFEKFQNYGMFKDSTYENQLSEYKNRNLEYEPLRLEYEKQRRPFHNQLFGFTDVIEHPAESHLTGAYQHPTQKPPSLVSKLIQLTTNAGDLILDPMAGSFVVAEQARYNNRNFICCDVDVAFCRIGEKRLSQLSLF